MKYMAAALIIENNRILLVNNTKHGSLRIEPPGGKKELDETLEECAVREVKEELGLDIAVKGLLGAYATESPEGPFEVYMYFSKIKKGKPAVQEPDIISGYAWYTIDDLYSLKEQRILVPNLCAALDDLKKYLK